MAGEERGFRTPNPRFWRLVLPPELSYTPTQRRTCRNARPEASAERFDGPLTQPLPSPVSARRASPRAVSRKDLMRSYSASKRRSPMSRPGSMKCAPWPRKAIRLRLPRKSASSRLGPKRRSAYATLTPWQKTLVARAQGDRGSATTSRGSSTSSRRSQATAISARTPSWAAWRNSTDASRSCSSARRRATTREPGAHNFGMGSRRAIGKATRLMELGRPIGLPVSPSLTPRAHFRESRPRSAARPKPSRGRSTLAARWTSELGVMIVGEGGVGRRARARRADTGAHAETRCLFGDLARSGGVDPVRTVASPGGGEG